MVFCFQVSVDVPDVKGRTEILKVHASNKKFEADVSLEVIAMRTPGFSGADLANLLNEGAILAGRRGKTAISAKEIDDSIDRIVAGMEGTIMTDGRSKSLVAYHEVGHAICGSAFIEPNLVTFFLVTVFGSHLWRLLLPTMLCEIEVDFRILTSVRCSAIL
jgi:ATP-dependent Zn protease